MENLIEIEPVVKHLDILSEDVQANMEVAQKFLMEGKVKEALEAYQNCIQLLLNVIYLSSVQIPFFFIALWPSSQRNRPLLCKNREYIL